MLRREELHHQELPVANLASLTANLNRDPESKAAPWRVSDFTFFGQQEESNKGPQPLAAAAYMALIDAGLLPGWALFCYQQVSRSAAGADPPALLAALGDGVVLLVPSLTSEGLSGLLLANHAVSGREVEVTVGSQRLLILVPAFDQQVIAREDVLLPVLRQIRSR